MQVHKDEIKRALEIEIISRYYFEKGKYEVNFKYDKDIAEAIKTIQSKDLIASILKGDGQFKVIGKPVLAVINKKSDKDSTLSDF